MDIQNTKNVMLSYSFGDGAGQTQHNYV